MKRINIIIFIATLAITCGYGQGGFNKNYFLNNSLNSLTTDAIEAPNGNLIIAGVTLDTLNNQSFYRLTIVGTASNGIQLWRKSYGKFKFQYLNNNYTTRSVITYSNCFYLYSAAKDSNNKYFSVLIKFNFNGDTLWQKKYYDATDYLYIQSVNKSVDNGFLMTGFFEGSLTTCLMIKTDSTGNELWRKKLVKSSTPQTQSGYRIIQDSLTKKIIIAGYEYQWDGTQPGGFSTYANIIITDSLGIELQRKTYSGACGSGFFDLIQTKDKKFIGVGCKDQCDNLSGPLGSRRYKGYAVKININSLTVPIWQKEFDITSTNNNINTINELPNGCLILSGFLDTLLNQNIPEKTMLRIIKLDANGNLIWKKYLSRDNIQANSKSPFSLNKCLNGDFILGIQLGFAANPKPYSITRVDSNGCDSTLAYCQTVGLHELVINNEYFRIYPNPSNELINIDLENFVETKNYSLKIINLLGQNVMDCKFEKTLNISSLKNGIYFLQVFDKEKLIATEKIIKE